MVLQGRRFWFFPVRSPPDNSIESGDPLPGEAYQNLIAGNNIQPLPACDRPQAHPPHLFIIKLYWIQFGYNGHLARSPDAKLYPSYFSNLSDRRIFPCDNPTAFTG